MTTETGGPQRERWVRKEVLYDGRVVRLEIGDVEFDDGTVAFREVVRHPGGVAVVPLLGEAVVLVRQYRIAVEAEVLELPAGKLEGAEDPEHRGRCELEEETGYRAGRMTPLGSTYASVGYTSEEIHLYLAQELEQVGQRLEADERIGAAVLTLDDVRRKLAANAFKDAKTVVGLYAMLAHLDGARR